MIAKNPKEREPVNLRPGARWETYPPTSADKARIAENIENEKLYEGDFKQILKRFGALRAASAGSPEIEVNFFQMMSQEFSKLIFSEDIIIKAPDKAQEAIDELIETTDLQGKLLQMSDIASSIGGTPIKAWRDDDGQVHIDLVPNNIYFPSLDPDDCTRLTGHTIAWERTDEETNLKFIIREIHTPGKIRREVLNSQMVQDEGQYEKWYSGIDREVATGYGGMLVEYIPNYRYGNKFWGISDYKKVRDVVEEIMVRMSSVADILDKHARPTKVYPAEILDKVKEMLDEYRDEMARNGLISRTEADVMTRSNNIPRGMDALYVPSADDNGNLPRMVTWDANLTGAMEELDRLFDLFLSLSCMTPEVFGVSKYGVSESGRALKFRNMRALGESNRKRQFLIPGLKRILRAALFLMGYDVNLRDIGIVTQDGLPFDELEASQISTMWLSAGLATQESAILNARPDITREQAEEEAAEIEGKRAYGESENLASAMPNNSARAVNPDGDSSEADTQAT